MIEIRVAQNLFDSEDIELTAAERKLILEALEHRMAYLLAVRRSRQDLNDLVERFRQLVEED